MLIVAALIPAASLAWIARDVPQLGFFHDDGIYWVCARSLATGAGYRISSLPGQPYQTKYPPGYPWLLALAWKLAPSFPGNLTLALALNWLTLPAFVLASRLVFRDLGASPGHVWLLCAILALGPYSAMCSITLLSELLFGSLLVIALALAERAAKPESGAWLVVAAGGVASAAFLTRTLGGLLFIVVPALLVWRGQRKRAAIFAGTMLPAVLGWALWTHFHRVTTTDPALLYYTDYLGFFKATTSPSDIPAMIWRNANSVVTSIGGLFLLGWRESFLGQTFARLLAAACITGLVRRFRRHGASAYDVFTAAYIVVLFGWNYMPDERYLLPVWPVLLTGFWVEMGAFWKTVRASSQTQPIASFLCTLTVTVLLCAIAAETGDVYVRFLPAFIDVHRRELKQSAPAYAWMRDHLPVEAQVLAYKDPLVYLYAGRRAWRIDVPPALFLDDDSEPVRKLFAGIPEFARSRGLKYVLSTPSDWSGELRGPERKQAQQTERSGTDFREIYRHGAVSVLQLN